MDNSKLFTQVNQIWKELNVFETSQEIAYRNGKRLTLSLKPINIKEKINPTETLKREMLYLVTGGLGGLGTDLILKLAKKYQMR